MKVSRAGALGIIATILLSGMSAQSSGWNRSTGEYWVYSIEFTVPELGVPATGTLRYEFVSEETIAVQDAPSPVNVMRVTGAVGASFNLIGLSVSIVIEGYVYEGAGDLSTVKSDLTYWTNLTWGSGSYSLANNTASREVSTYAPPLMAGFDPISTPFGSVWTETNLVRTYKLNVSTGLEESNSTNEMTIEYRCSSQLESVKTGAGQFDALRITAKDDVGGRTVYWWCSEVGFYVRQETYMNNMSQAVQTLSLEDYSGGREPRAVLFVAIGVAAMAVVLVFLVMVLIKRRPPRTTQANHQSVELLPPPP